ncbi:hypothetical protein [Streptomonospora litoralis]|uniref:DUF4126 domain-containing protein n=1 Tax=Streptomonospora litoralis TaxID=2498135 RepID=A0A4P6Q1L2_9ACTN|nr:hypothetical protein [Streptomonospora litoralis]QBI53990.1 hypothetical protein EKD16_11025 [Streptomonospora litoralis]
MGKTAKRPRRPGAISGFLRGALAGAAGTTALNITSGLDQAIRGRPASEAPQRLVATAADAAGMRIPGGRKERSRRLAALGPVAGAAAGIGIGGAAGVLRSWGLRPPVAVGGPLLCTAAMGAADGPLALARISDPRQWSAADWAADVGPHLAYGVTTHAALVASEPVAPDEEVPPPRCKTLLRALALGAATGSRSSLGVTAIALSSTQADQGPVARRMGSRSGRAAAALLAGGELALDKHPAAPPRTDALGTGMRALLGAAAARAAAHREHDHLGPATLVGSAGAIGAAALGVRLRAAATRRFGSDIPGAVAEDTAAALLAWAGTRRT